MTSSLKGKAETCECAPDHRRELARGMRCPKGKAVGTVKDVLWQHV